MRKKLNKNDNFSPKVARSIAVAELFLERLAKKPEVSLRMMLIMDHRLRALHKTIKSIPEFRKLEKDIDAALFEIARAKIRREQKLKIKKKVRTYGDSTVNRKKKR